MKKIIIIISILIIAYIVLYFALNKNSESICLYKGQLVKVIDSRSSDGGISVYDLKVKKYIGSLGGGMVGIPDGKGGLKANPGDISRSSLYCLGKSY